MIPAKFTVTKWKVLKGNRFFRGIHHAMKAPANPIQCKDVTIITFPFYLPQMGENNNNASAVTAQI